MSRFEKLIDMDVEDVATVLCEDISDKVKCNDCPFTDRCGLGHNGVLDWLTEEVEE